MTRRRQGSPPTPGGEGRFDGYDVMDQQAHWDPVTAAVVRQRTQEKRALSFFTAEEAEICRAVVDLVLANHNEPRVPVLEMIDQRLFEGVTDGWRYQDMPEDRDAWRQTLAFVDEDATAAFGTGFAACTVDQQARLVQGVQDSETWHGLAGGHVWSLWTRYACAAFYAHPWAWNEIGFGGPAYPRGYKVLHLGWREPWEVAERAPVDPVPWSDQVEQAKRAHEVRVGTRP
jgi:Gluconate 2-dehydrogenase subunit 3